MALCGGGVFICKKALLQLIMAASMFHPPFQINEFVLKITHNLFTIFIIVPCMLYIHPVLSNSQKYQVTLSL